MILRHFCFLFLKSCFGFIFLTFLSDFQWFPVMFTQSSFLFLKSWLGCFFLTFPGGFQWFPGMFTQASFCVCVKVASDDYSWLFEQVFNGFWLSEPASSDFHCCSIIPVVFLIKVALDGFPRLFECVSEGLYSGCGGTTVLGHTGAMEQAGRRVNPYANCML